MECNLQRQPSREREVKERVEGVEQRKGNLGLFQVDYLKIHEVWFSVVCSTDLQKCKQKYYKFLLI